MLILACMALAAFGPTQERPAAPPPTPPATPPAQGRGARTDDDKGPPVLGADAIPQEEGRIGDLPPLARHVELSAASFDLDTVGRARTELAGLVGSAQGFTLLLGDDRDGSRNYLLVPLDAELAPQDAQRIDGRESGKGETDAVLATSGSEMLGAVWLDVADESGILRGRAWDAQGQSVSEWSMPLPADRRDPAERLAAAGTTSAGIEPALLLGDTNWTVAFQIAGIVLVRDVDPKNGAKSHEEVLTRRSRPASSGPLLARDSQGRLACAFDAAGAVVLFVRLAEDEKATCGVGPGMVFGLAADPNAEDGGWWVLMRYQRQLFLRHLDHSGAADRKDLLLVDRALDSAALAATSRGLCVLVQYVKGGLDALWVGTETPSPSVSKTEVCAADRAVITSRLACRGERFAFAWSERRAAQIELFTTSCLRGGGELAAERSSIKGDGRGLQFQPAIGFAGERGIVAWTDQRFGGAVVGARGFTSDRKQGSEELFLPATIGSGDVESARSESLVRPLAKRPAVAVQPSGRALVSWLGAGAKSISVFAQLIDVDADASLRAVAGAIELDPSPTTVSTNFAPAILALRDERGFVVAWVRPAAETGAKSDAPSDDGRSEVRIVRVSAAGLIDLPARTAASGPRLSHPALAQLDDGRIVLAWDAQPHVDARRLAARVFSERLEPEKRELCFETMWRKSDHSATVAPATGGFALAWVSGEEQDSDIFARLYDSDGRPLSRPIALTTRQGGQRLPCLSRAPDGGFVAVWQDNLSREPRLVGRRFSAKGTQPGLCVRFSFGPEPRVADFSMPGVIALAGGRLALAGEHVVLGKGREIGLCLLGLGWDEVEGR